MNEVLSDSKRLESQPFFTWIDDGELRNQLSIRLIKAKKRRKEAFTQMEVSHYIQCPLTKVKEIEAGKTKDFNAINNYLNLMGV